MATPLSFTAEEWAVVRSAPQVVSMAVAGAGGGILGAIKETMAGGQAMLDNAQSRSPLVQKLCTAEEIQAAQEDLQKLVMSDPSNGTAEKLKALAVQLCTQAAGILSQNAPSELSAFQSLILSVADTVAKAAKEGGFFGFGGELVSEGEQQVIAAVQAALQTRAGNSGTFSIPAPTQQPAQKQPSTPSQPSGPVGPSRSAGLPGLEPKSSTPPPATQPSTPPPASKDTPQSGSSKPKSSSGLSSKSGSSSTAKTKGGFRTGSGLRKADS
ncbi:MAG: hypothetical protein U0175_33975 [Caldilineaceae bacterium]